MVTGSDCQQRCDLCSLLFAVVATKNCDDLVSVDRSRPTGLRSFDYKQPCSKYSSRSKSERCKPSGLNTAQIYAGEDAVSRLQ